MRPVSAAWLRTVQGSYTPITRITLCRDYQTGPSPVGQRIDLVDGSVHLDGAADIYTTARLTFPDDLWDVLQPYGAEVYVQTGIRYSDALVELVGLGYLRLRLPSQQDAQQRGPVQLTAEDRMSTIARADLLRPRQWTAATTYGQMASDLVTEVYPDAVIVWDDHAARDAPIARTVVVDQYRLDALKGIALATGKIVRWDGIGQLTFITPIALLGAAPVARLATGRGGVIATLAREVSDASVTNAWVVRGDGMDGSPPAYGVAIDNDPRSPTRYSGRFGPAPVIQTSSLVTTDAQALSAAQSLRAQGAGLAYTLSWTGSPRPELEPSDLIYLDQTRDTLSRHLIASLDIPLIAGGSMSAISRQQAVGAAS